MDGERRESNSLEAWLLETCGAVERAVLATDGIAPFTRAVPDALTTPKENTLAFIARPAQDRSSLVIREASPSLPDSVAVDSESSTAQVIDSGAIQRVQTDEHPEYNRLRETAAIEEASGAVSIPLPDPQLTGVLHLYTNGDVSRERAGESFERLAGLLEETIRRRAESDALERERERLEQLRSLVSHDLGNPINVAAGRLDLVGMDCESEHIEHVESALRQLESLADEGNKFVTVGRKVNERTTIDLAELARECWEPIETGTSELSVQSTSVYAESERLRMVLRQLFENAVIHNDDPVTVTVGPLESDRGFYVADDGVGIPADQREYVFDRGYTTDSDRAGNGLAIVTEIAGAFGWELDIVDSNETRIDVRTGSWSTISA